MIPSLYYVVGPIDSTHMRKTPRAAYVTVLSDRAKDDQHPRNVQKTQNVLERTASPLSHVGVPCRTGRACLHGVEPPAYLSFLVNPGGRGWLAGKSCFGLILISESFSLPLGSHKKYNLLEFSLFPGLLVKVNSQG